MGLKKKNKKRDDDIHSRQKGNSRVLLVLEIVATDSTFELLKIPVRRHFGEHNDDIEKWIGKCIHCNTKLTVLPSGKTDATVEHIMPLCAGGVADDLRNVALACSRCNNQKGISHDAKHLDERAKQVIESLLEKRAKRWRDA